MEHPPIPRIEIADTIPARLKLKLNILADEPPSVMAML